MPIIQQPAEQQQQPAKQQQQAEQQLQQQAGLPHQQQQQGGLPQQQQLCILVHKEAVLSDGHKGKSMLFQKSQSRDGNHVLVYEQTGGEERPRIGQVQYYLELQCRVTPAAAAAETQEAAGSSSSSRMRDGTAAVGNSSRAEGSSSSSSRLGGSSNSQCGSSRFTASCWFAVMKYFKPASKPVTKFDKPQVAEVLVEGRPDHFITSQAEPDGVLRVVPLQCIHSPVHVHTGPAEDAMRLTFVLVLSSLHSHAWFKGCSILIGYDLTCSWQCVEVCSWAFLVGCIVLWIEYAMDGAATMA